MILTVTINPLLEFRFVYPKVIPGNFHRNGKEYLLAGGKGINVSRQLNYLGVPNIALTFLGGSMGKLLRNQLSEEKINFSAIKTKGETRKASVIIDEQDQKVTMFFGSNTGVSGQEANEFIIKLEKMIRNCEIVVFSGSSPCAETNKIFPAGIKIANQYDKISICDTYGAHMQDCINASPTVIHNNLEETESSLIISLKSENEKRQYLDLLYGKGIKQVFLTDGGSPVYASNFDFHFRCDIPYLSAVDPTGSGDSFTAALAYGLYHDLTFEETLLFGVSLGCVNASRTDICNVKPDEAQNIKHLFSVSPVGKKMKVIDVTPR